MHSSENRLHEMPHIHRLPALVRERVVGDVRHRQCWEEASICWK